MVEGASWEISPSLVISHIFGLERGAGGGFYSVSLWKSDTRCKFCLLLGLGKYKTIGKDKDIYGDICTLFILYKITKSIKVIPSSKLLYLIF